MGFVSPRALANNKMPVRSTQKRNPSAMSPPLIQQSTRARFYTGSGPPRDLRVPDCKAGGAQEDHARGSTVGRGVAPRANHRPEGRPADQHAEVEERGKERERSAALRLACPLHDEAGQDWKREAVAEAAQDPGDRDVAGSRRRRKQEQSS